MTVKDQVRPLPGVHQLSLLRQRAALHGSASYWERNNARGGASGEGSYHDLAEAKATFLNDFVLAHDVTSVLEFGCGDGNQLSLADYPRYIGLDVSLTAIKLCQRRFADDPTKSFFLRRRLPCRPGWVSAANLAISLDAIYHLTEDTVFEAYMRHLFAAGSRFLIIDAIDRRYRARHRTSGTGNASAACSPGGKGRR